MKQVSTKQQFTDADGSAIRSRYQSLYWRPGFKILYYFGSLTITK
jgi:hypothetical protein